jgi:hypothetical protein
MKRFCYWFSGIAMASVVIWELLHPKPRVDHADDHAKLFAKIACRDAVAKRLRAPSTADFAGVVLGDWTVSKINQTYVISSAVDSQNGFGAQVRTDFTCTVTNPDTSKQKVMVVLGE